MSDRDGANASHVVVVGSRWEQLQVGRCCHEDDAKLLTDQIKRALYSGLLVR